MEILQNIRTSHLLLHFEILALIYSLPNPNTRSNKCHWGKNYREFVFFVLLSWCLHCSRERDSDLAGLNNIFEN